MKTKKSPSIMSPEFDVETAYKVVSAVILKYMTGIPPNIVRKYEIPDIVQDVVIRALGYSYSFDESKGTFSGWVAVVAHRYAVDFVKKRYKMYNDTSFIDLDEKISGGRNPERCLLDTEENEAIDSFLNSLNSNDRLCFEMMSDGMKPRQISQELGCSANAATVRAFRLRGTYRQFRDEVSE